MQFVVALELLLQPLAELAAGVQARDLVFVLVRHQLEQVAPDGLGQVGAARRARLLGGAHARHEVGVAPRVAGALVVAQERRAARDHLVERARQARVVERPGHAAMGRGAARRIGVVRGHMAQRILAAGREQSVVEAGLVAFRRPRCQQRQRERGRLGGGRHVAHDAGRVEHRRQVDRRQPAPREGGLVHLHRGAVELDRAHQRFQRQRHQPALPGVAEHEQVAADRVAEQRGRDMGRVDLRRRRAAERGADGGDDVARGELHVGARGERARHRLVGVEHDLGAAGADLRQRPVVVDHDHVAAQHQVGLAGGDAHGVDLRRCARDADVRGHRTALLREAGLVEHGRALALEVPGHAEQRADGDDAGAADAGDQDVPGLREIGRERRRRQVRQALGRRDLAALARLAAVHGHEARAEALDAAVVLVAVALVDLALAAVLGVLRQHRHAERLLPAVAATLAHQRVHEHALLRVHHLAALAPPPLLRGAGLVVDQDAGALHFAQPLLHRVELAAVEELDAFRERARRQRSVGPLPDLVREHDDRSDALRAHLARDLRHAQRAVHRLAAGHRDRVVVEDLVGDVDAAGDRLADRQRAGVEVGAVAQVLEHVRRVGERRLPGPGHAFAAHVGEGVGRAVHPRDHVVAADARQRARALRHLRRRVVRAARAVVRHAREVRARQRELAFLRLHPRQHLAHALGRARLHGDQALDAARDDARDARGREFARRRQDPFARFVVLADDGRPLPLVVVEQLLHLALDEGLLLLDHHDVLQPARERADAGGLERPGHADLVDADAEVAAGRLVQAEVFERLQHVEVALAGGDDAQARVRRIDRHAVDAVGARERLRGLHRVHVQAHFLVERRIRPADVEAARRDRELVVARQHDPQRERIDVHRRRGFHRFGDRLEADPTPRVTRHRPAEQAHLEDVLHAGRVQHRHQRGDELALGAVRQRRRAARVVVGRQREHAAVLRGARRVRVLEHVAAAVHARALAVPHAEHAVVLRAREQADLLRAPDHGRAEVLVEARGELHARRLEVLARAPQLQVEAAERRSAVAADEAGGVEARRRVAQLLHQRQPHQRLHAGQVDPAGFAAVLVVQGVVGIDDAPGQAGVGGGGGAEFGGAGHAKL